MQELHDWLEYVEDVRQQSKVRHRLKDILIRIVNGEETIRNQSAPDYASCSGSQCLKNEHAGNGLDRIIHAIVVYCPEGPLTFPFRGGTIILLTRARKTKSLCCPSL